MENVNFMMNSKIIYFLMYGIGKIFNNILEWLLISKKQSGSVIISQKQYILNKITLN